MDFGKEQLICLNAQEETEVLASDVWRFTISDGHAYVINAEEIRRIDLMTREDRLLVKKDTVL